MMLIITDKNPNKAVNYLIEHTNKNFVFKQLLELGQLICSADISDVYKKINQGKKLQEWIIKNPHFIYTYFLKLLLWCLENINLKQKTVENFNKILENFKEYIDKHNLLPANIYEKVNNISSPKTAIFRYKKDYECEYNSNEELDIDLCCYLYRDYLNYKFKKGGKDENDR